MRQNPARIDSHQTASALNLRSLSLDKLRQIVTTGASVCPPGAIFGSLTDWLILGLMELRGTWLCLPSYVREYA
eukprot:COSAG01_NODE_712_length_14100_cov_12.382758_3_plen_74_part_00